MPKQYTSVLNPEERILLNCARLEQNEHSAAALEKLLQGRVDWEALLVRSVKQSMTPLLYRHLRGEAALWRRVPEVMRMRLQQIYQRNIQRNELLLAELDQLFAVFNAAEVPVMLMKELHLLHTIYPEIGLRPIGDLDLLVPPHDFERSKTLLRQAGYHPQLPTNPFKDKYGFGYHFVNHAKGIWIDLQWNLSQRDWAQSTSGACEFRAPIKEVWKHAQKNRLLESHIMRMSWEDMLFHLCVHLEGHGFNEMIQFCDMAEIIRQYGTALDWRRFINIARGAAMQGSVACALEFVQKVLGVAAPAEVLAELRPDYLKFGMYNASFGTLGRLHTFLDEAASDDCVPARALKQWEATVRTTATLNQQAYIAINSATQALANEGLHPVVLLTRSAEQLLPHPALERMGEIEILAVKQARVEQAATKNEALDATVVQPRWWSAAPKYSSRRLLKKILRSPVRPKLHNVAQASLPADKMSALRSERMLATHSMTIHLVAPEEALLALCLRFSRSAAPWQALSYVAEFLRRHAEVLDWPKFHKQVQAHAASREVALVLHGVAQLTNVTLPATAFEGFADGHVQAGLDLFPLPAAQANSEARVKQAIQKILRAALLPTWKDRKDYLMRLVEADNLFAQCWKPAVAALKFGAVLLREKMRRPAPQEKLQAYWLEMPQLSASAEVVFEPHRASTAEIEALQPMLAAA